MSLNGSSDNSDVDEDHVDVNDVKGRKAPYVPKYIRDGENIRYSKGSRKGQIIRSSKVKLLSRHRNGLVKKIGELVMDADALRGGDGGHAGAFFATLSTDGSVVFDATEELEKDPIVKSAMQYLRAILSAHYLRSRSVAELERLARTSALPRDAPSAPPPQPPAGGKREKAAKDVQQVDSGAEASKKRCDIIMQGLVQGSTWKPSWCNNPKVGGQFLV
jgi:hypothetical protein